MPRTCRSYPVCNRARVVSFDRPYDTGDGASDFFGDEYPLVRFCEQHGLDLAYVTDVTVTEHPSIVARHTVLLSLGHDESWSYQERVGVTRRRPRGSTSCSSARPRCSATCACRHLRSVRTAKRSTTATPSEDPLDGHGSPMQVTGNTWSSPPTNWSAEAFIGEVYSGYLEPGLTAPFVVADAQSWVFRGHGAARRLVAAGRHRARTSTT